MRRGGVESGGCSTLIEMKAELPGRVSDDALVERFRATGDSAFFEEIFRRHRQEVHRCCFHLLRDPETAADLTQETFLKALSGIGRYAGGNLRGWLVTIARHQCMDYFRSLHRGTRTMVGPEALAAIEVNGEDVVGKLTLAALLERVNEEQRVCLKLFYLNGMSYDGIARITGWNEGSVKSHIQNGLKRLRRAQVEK
jgi:RNA polymerase sigma-70 factor (ECF subfamily)